jgi:hypothetical protein
MSDDIDYKLRRETEAAKQLVTMLKTSGDADDENLVADSIEGETDLMEAIEATLDEIDLEEAMVRGLEDKMEDFDERKQRIKKRIERQRAAIEQAMVICDREKIMLPTATLSLRKVPRAVIIDNEADIPSDYFVIPKVEPRLDRKALKEALTDGATIDGAHLDNGSVTLQVYRK